MQPHYEKRSFFGALLGAQIRGTIKGDGALTSSKIYRSRKGNGYVGTQKGKTYQDKYDYFVPTSILDPAGDHSREIFSAAVSAYQNSTEDEKNLWRKKGYKVKGMTGYNLFIRDYMNSNL